MLEVGKITAAWDEFKLHAAMRIIDTVLTLGKLSQKGKGKIKTYRHICKHRFFSTGVLEINKVHYFLFIIFNKAINISGAMRLTLPVKHWLPELNLSPGTHIGKPGKYGS